MTPNIGAEYLVGGALGGQADADIDQDTRERVTAELRGHFRPEFLNRVDDIVLFRRLTLPEIERIVELQFDQLRSRLAERQLRLEVTDEARRMIADARVRPGVRRPAAASVHRPRGGDPYLPGAARRRPVPRRSGPGRRQGGFAAARTPQGVS
jgi:ATP-dependent Clp protease ATP-binding subunit ClpA